MIRSFFSSAIILLYFAVFQSAVLSNITILPTFPDFLLICVLFFSVENGKILGESMGFISGLFLDFLSACPFGLNCLYRTIIGYVGGIFNKELNIEGFFVPVLLSFCATLLKVALIFLISILYPSITLSYKIISVKFLFELAMNSILAPFVFKFLLIFKNLVLIKVDGNSR